MILDSILDRVADQDPAPDTAISRKHLYCECRRCGTTVSPSTATCPQCGAQEISRLELR